MSSVKTNIVIILAAISLLVGCGGSPAVTSKPTKTPTLPAPVWLIQPPIEMGFLYGTGSAGVYAGDQAGAAARAASARRLMTTITSNW